MLCHLLDVGEEKEKKEREREMAVFFSPGLDLLCWLCCGSQLLGAIKG
jgi:hypothetical protein